MGIDANVSLKPSNEPELPRVYVDTTYSAPTGTTWVVNSGENFQTALNNAALDDIIQLEAGATFTGNFTLPNKTSGSGWIYVVSSGLASLPVAGTRVAPSDASNMAKITTSSGSAITSLSGAHHFRLVGLEIAAGALLNSLIELSGGQSNLSTQTNNITIDRCYIHGHATNGTTRGISAQGAALSVIDSYVSDFKEVGRDSQAFAAWNGSGPYKLANNYFEGAGENVLFGGSTCAAEEFIPSDIEIVRNHCAKPLTWKADDPSYLGVQWQVKNIFELKNVQRVLVEGNLFERNWAQAQDGFAILFTPRNQGGTSPFTKIRDVTFRSNVLRSSACGINMQGWDDEYESEQTLRISISNNLLVDIDSTRWGGENGKLFQTLGGNDFVKIEHNTASHSGNVVNASGDPSFGFVYRYNVTPHNSYGIIGAASVPGLTSINIFYPGSSITENVFANAGEYADDYPSGNYFPATFLAVGFVDLNAGDYQLTNESPYKSIAPGGADLGIDKAALDVAMASMAQTYW